MSLNKHYRQLWAAAGYRTDYGSAAVVPPPKRHLIRLYHFTNAEHAINDMAFSRIKLARFNDLNDPFELMAVNLREAKARKTWRDLKDRENESIALICFSGDWTSPVLWSHYADKHRGVCLGFDVKRSLVQPVNYETERLENFITDAGKPKTLDASEMDTLKRTKYKHWDYEQEWRMFVPLQKSVREGSLHFRAFGKGIELREVILGPHCVLDLAKVRCLVTSRYNGISTIKARLARFRHRFADLAVF